MTHDMRQAPDCTRKLSYMSTYMALSDRFNYEVFHRMPKEPSGLVDTVGVTPDGVGVKFLYNPWYVDSLRTEELAYMVGHEVGHVVMHHFDKSRPTDQLDQVLYDVAADLAINSLFPPEAGVKDPPRRRKDVTLPDGSILLPAGASECVLPENFGFSPRLSHEAYLDLLTRKYEGKRASKGKSTENSRQDSGKSSGGSGSSGKGKVGAGKPEEADRAPGENGDGQQGEQKQPGSHAGWERSTLANAAVKEWVETVRSGNAWGSLPGHAIRAILSSQESTVSWDTLLREKYGNMHSSRLASTYKRPSRRFGYPWCSKKMEPRDKKLVLIDTSASISQADLSRFRAETDRLSEIQCVYYMTFDTRLHQEEALPWSAGMDIGFTGGGGTNILTAIRYAEEHQYQDCVVLTDGYFAKPRKPEGVEVLWVITKGGSKTPADFGEVILMN